MWPPTAATLRESKGEPRLLLRLLLLLLLLITGTAGRGGGLAVGALAGEPVRPDESMYGVFSMACTYRRVEVEVFVGSLRATGFGGVVQFGVDKAVDEEMRAYLAANRVTVDSLPCETIPLVTPEQRALPHGLWLGGLNQARYTHYLRWLAEHDFERVWLLDARDVIFLRNPFESAPHNLVLFAEMPTTSVWVAQRVSACFGDEISKEMMRTLRYNLCGGTVYGTSAGIAGFAREMAGVGKDMSLTGAQRRVCHVNDQPLINYLTYREGIRAPGKLRTKNLGAVELHIMFHGPALTIKTPRVCEMFTGRLRKNGNDTGDLAIVHKWNKCPAARALARSRFPTLPVDKVVGNSVSEELKFKR
ncbi:hypothetical protein T492DRAFT_1140922 [Pavlovales sp. CCMP2436]|nr:hypothetical protein T492DRAFT_1140922 [Pavlovales sp. CCMP2436]